MTGRTERNGAPALRQRARRFGRGRRAFFAAVQRLARGLGGRRFYRRWHLAPGRFRVRRETLHVGAVHQAFAGFRIVQWSDPHAGPFLGTGDLAHVVEASNALQPDLVVITGDLLTDEPHEALALLEDFGALRAREGVFAVLGNHDYRRRADRDLARRFARDADVRFLLGETVRIERGAATLALVGLEDLEESREPDLARAFREVRPGDLQVVLCHNPAGAGALAAPGVALVLSGHTHGHQLDVPLLRRLAPRHPGDRRQLGSTVAITSRGLGALGLPLRLRSPAELVVIDFVAEPSGDRDAR